MAAIYGLLHPTTGELRYIGKASNPAKRMASHLRDARHRQSPLYAWLRKMVAAGSCPDMIVLEEACADWRASERNWIARARRAGLRLLNLADGGDEPACPLAVRQANGRNNARQRCPVITGLLRQLGEDARYFDKRGDTRRAELMRYCQGRLRSLDQEGRRRFVLEWKRRRGGMGDG